MDKRKAAIIGSGLGGLSAALRLAHNDFQVDIYESNSFPGGKAGSLNLNKFRFDTGPSLLTMPFIIKDLFSSVGENWEDYLTLSQPNILTKYFYSDGTIINAFSDTYKFANEIEEKTNDSATSIVNYLNYSKRIYELTAELFLFNSLDNISNYFSKKSITTLINIADIDSFRTMDQANRSFFDDKKIIQLFNRYATYNGSNPFRTPATLNIIQHVEYNIGGYIIKGGMYSLVDAIIKAARKLNVNFYFNNSVDTIIINKNKVTGIKVKDTFFKYDIVLSNADVNSTYKKLINDDSSLMAKRYDKLEPSSSAVIFYWGISKTFPELEIHNILFSEDYRKEFKEIFEDHITPEDPTVYIYISSKFNPSDAPENQENWFVMINAPYLTGNNRVDIAKTKDVILKKINKFLNTNIENFISCEEVLTPDIIEERTSSYRGSLYGISSNSRFAAFLRQQNKSYKYKGLYFAGGSAHPGGGIPLAILSGKLAYEKILKDIN